MPPIEPISAGLGGARVAVEHFTIDRPSTSISQATVSLVPDPLAPRRDHGPRVAIWRRARRGPGRCRV
ncbi:hypothetical protein [Sphaerisporangium fuscum]|uniref:hypothetical protein n=1 Tax=Sphaerisporangium fuscum TaxID=2835868 RepID=UPI001BDBBE68|nr:hypothetical protein [Sphaerisporangium fuscum]